MPYLRIITFSLAVLVTTELSVRVWMYGPLALLPWHMDSFTQIHDSGMLQRASIPEQNYELRANLDVLFKGKPFKTNSAGMRDKEYPQSKPAGIFRVAVLGSSWTMGSGVAHEDIWLSQLEEMLNQNGKTPHYEFLNFGVDQYGLGELAATIEHKVPAYQPDLVIVALTYYTPTVLWEEPPPPYEAPPKRHPFFDVHASGFWTIDWAHITFAMRKVVEKLLIRRVVLLRSCRKHCSALPLSRKPMTSP